MPDGAKLLHVRALDMKMYSKMPDDVKFLDVKTFSRVV